LFFSFKIKKLNGAKNSAFLIFLGTGGHRFIENPPQPRVRSALAGFPVNYL